MAFALFEGIAVAGQKANESGRFAEWIEIVIWCIQTKTAAQCTAVFVYI